jgi:FkbM family methyltransferase
MPGRIDRRSGFRRRRFWAKTRHRPSGHRVDAQHPSAELPARQGTLAGDWTYPSGKPWPRGLAWAGRGFRLAETSHITQRAPLFADQRGARLLLALPAGPWQLRFVRHGWSGEILLRDAGTSRIIDLFADGADSGALAVTVEAAGPDAPLTIELTGTRNPRSQDGQCWLLEASCAAGRFYPERGSVVSNTCRIVQGLHGDFLALRSDTSVPEAVAGSGVWEPASVAAFRAMVRPAETVIDAGAHIGHHTVVLSRQVGPAGQVFAFEPQTPMFQLLNANLVLNGCRNVTAFPQAVGAEPGWLPLRKVSYDAFQPFASLQLVPRAWPVDRGEMVAVVALDALLPRLPAGAGRLSYLKLDVQAFEFHAMLGARELIAAARPTIDFKVSPKWMREAGSDHRGIAPFLADLGYRLYDHRFQPTGIPEGDSGEDWEREFLAIHPRYADRIPAG